MSDTFFTGSPHWAWWIIFYFFIGGIAGTVFLLVSLLHLFGRPANMRLVRSGYYLAFAGALVSGFLLTIDLDRPLRFWHMLIQSNTGRPMFKSWVPMSVGSWGLLLFGFFSFLAAVAALTLGIGANTAIFSVVNAVLLKPVSFLDPDRLVVFMNTSPQGSGPAASPAKFQHYREQNAVVQDVSAFRTGIMNYTSGSFPEQLRSGQVSSDFFKLFGAPVIRGRTFTAQEDLPDLDHHPLKRQALPFQFRAELPLLLLQLFLLLSLPFPPLPA